ncbi:CBS domain-containing protein CBSCBSPB1-like [Apium graveolens]|uniref:CBS domain-containing protein CBSCBSPB1-like n=1 Tax=Apium graveolens TaxID=4045 RepID=UPI003D7BB5AE
MAGSHSSRRSMSMNSRKKKSPEHAGGGHESGRRARALSSSRSLGPLSGERTVKRLRLSKALTVSDDTSIREACCRMAARRVDALLLTDSNALLCGILTDKDVATKVIAQGISLEDPVSTVMTRKPVFVFSDTLAVDALQKMVNGKFRHLPVVDKGEVIALLDIAKCLHDAIIHMERVAERQKVMSAAVEGAEKHLGSQMTGQNSFIETLREKVFRPSLSTIINDNTKIVTLSPTDTVVIATKKMLESHAGSAVVTIDGKLQGILTSKDILMRVIAQGLQPEVTFVDMVMTPSPECATVDTPIVDALHTMHEGKFLHLPIIDRDGVVVAVTDVLNITHGAIASVANAGVNNESASSMMQKFWDHAMALSPIDDDDETRSDNSMKMLHEGTEIGRQSSLINTSFGFKIQDRKGRMHRFNCDTRRMTELVNALIHRVGDDIDRTNMPQILYEDEDHDKVVLATDSDLMDALDYARSAGLKELKLHLDYTTPRRKRGTRNLNYAKANASRAPTSQASTYSIIAAGTVLVVGLAVVAWLRRARN